MLDDRFDVIQSSPAFNLLFKEKNLVDIVCRGSSPDEVGLQMGTTEASRYWVYWVPAQYVDSIKDAILGTWLL
ncbi:Ubiquitin domain-containing protein ubfd1 [Homalodisca vitripennis]|nr:Ubiquitin domain-containing protein ubfd1 [Homalodisca vitripennis]